MISGLQELEEVAEILKTEQEDAQASLNERHSKSSGEAVILPYWKGKDGADTEAMKFSYATEVGEFDEFLFLLFICMEFFCLVCLSSYKLFYSLVVNGEGSGVREELGC